MVYSKIRISIQINTLYVHYSKLMSNAKDGLKPSVPDSPEFLVIDVSNERLVHNPNNVVLITQVNILKYHYTIE